MIKAVLLSFSFVSIHIILVMSFRKMKVEICVIDCSDGIFKKVWS